MTTGLPKHIIPNSQAHVDFLMQERVECLGKDGGLCMPMQPFKVGDILHRTNGNISIWVNEEGETLSCLVDEYPHLFSRIPWYLKRTESELPKYVKFTNGDVVEWNIVIAQMVKYWGILPATQQEYDNQNKQQ